MTGDGTGGTEKRVGETDSREECAALVYREHPSANGATYSNDGGTACYAEFAVVSSNGVATWQTCIFERKIRCI